MTLHLKNPDEIAAMREAGRIVARAHAAMKAAIRPGISTAELDKIAETVIRDHGATPAFLGVQKQKAPDFPATITASINHELIHGIPRKDRILKEGDVIGLDTGCHYQGFVGDSAWTYVVGEPSPMVARFLKVAEEALWVGIGASVLPHTIRDVALAIQKHVEKHGYSVAREYTGHGVGRAMHEEPEVPNWWPKRPPRGQRWENPRLQAGMTYALEPMVIAGRGDTRELSDGWTVVSMDRSLCAHFEHTIAVTDGGPIVLTLL
jgi:methionyl aminopeptidase